MAELQAVWEEAIQQYVQTLTAKERDCMGKINSPEQLLERARGLQKKYDSRKLASMLRRLSPFSGVVNTLEDLRRQLAGTRRFHYCIS